MKKRLLSIALVGLCHSSLHAQWANIGPGGQSLSSVAFYDANLGFTCGSAGSIYRTLDGGTTWTLIPNFQTPGLANRLRAVAFGSRTNVFAIWETPSLPQPTTSYISTNSGNVFNEQGYGSFVNMSIRYPTLGLQSLGIQVGDAGTLRISTMGGTLWRDVISGTQQTLRDGDCPTGGDCYVVGDLGVVRKNLPGDLLTWRAVNSTTSAQLNGVWFTDPQHGCIVGNGGTALRTANGGTTWTPMPVGTTVNLNDVRFLSAMVGFIAGDFGTVLLTTDGGATWQPESTNTFESLASITATDDGSATWIAGDAGTVLKRGPVVLATTASTRFDEWRPYPNPFTQQLVLPMPASSRQIEVQLLDPTGRMLLQQSIGGQTAQREVPLALPPHLAAGVYILQVKQDNQITQTHRITRLP